MAPARIGLHEEVIPITAIWTEAERERKPLRPLGESGEERTLNQLEEALRDAREAPGTAVARIQALMARDIADLVPTLEKIAAERLATVSGTTRKSAARRKRDRCPSCSNSSGRGSPRRQRISTRTSSPSIWCPRSGASGRPTGGIGKAV